MVSSALNNKSSPKAPKAPKSKSKGGFKLSHDKVRGMMKHIVCGKAGGLRVSPKADTLLNEMLIKQLTTVADAAFTAVVAREGLRVNEDDMIAAIARTTGSRPPLIAAKMCSSRVV
jgi:hypothetical protein